MKRFITNYDDILDSQTNNMNWLNDKPYSDTYKDLAKKWSKLPIYTDKENIINLFNLLDTKQVILIKSGTGSGKTVIIPKLILKYMFLKNIPGKIAITNPKILSTVSNAEYGAKTLDVNLGEEVGYKYKGASKKYISNSTKLIYLTDGLLLSIIANTDKYLKDYVGIIIDEAHERHIQIDLLLKLLKEIILYRKDFKLIIMSATINAKVFRNYFNIKKIKYGELEIYGTSNLPIEQIWAKKNITSKNYLSTSIKICNEILDKALNNNNDIIIFVPTQKDTINGCELISNTNKNLFCVEVFSNMSNENKELAISKDLYKKSGYNIKVIFAIMLQNLQLHLMD